MPGWRRAEATLTGAAVSVCLCACAPERAAPSPTSERFLAAAHQTTPSTLDAAAGPAGVVAVFLRDRMLRASVVMIAPDALNRGEPGVASLRVAPSTVPRAVLEQELHGRLERAGYDASISLPVAPRLVASLAATQDCEIALTTPPAERDVAFGERTTWEWSVRATRATGRALDLAVTLVAPVVVDGRETRFEVGVYRQQVIVHGTYRDRVADTLSAVGGMWAVPAAAATSILVIGGWTLRARRRRRPRALH